MMLELENVSKAFGATVALSSASLRVEPATVHGLVGPNGAGKSTLVKIASGQLVPDAGVVRVAGAKKRFRRPSDAHAHGIVAMPQDIALIPDLSVAENVVLGHEPRLGPILWPGQRRRAARSVLARLGVELPLDAPALSLRPADQRLVMLAQSLFRRARVVILDEPTAAMGVSDAGVVLAAVTSLRSEGVSIVYVSHRFDEVVSLCDFVTVIRDGSDVMTVQRRDLTAEVLVQAVVGEGNLMEAPARVSDIGETLCTVNNLRGRELRGVSAQLRTGEILGVAGLPGSGVSELLEVMAGVRRPAAGDIVLAGRRRVFGSPADAVAVGIAYLPGERSRIGFSNLPVRTNVVISRLEAVFKMGLITVARERKAAREAASLVGLATRVDDPLAALSGGNQQKALVARSLFARSSVLVLDDPTAGVDVKARADIHVLLRRLADEGKSVVLSSSEPEELAALADRVVVLSRGRVAAVLSGRELTPEAVIRSSTATMPAASGDGDPTEEKL